MQLSRVPINHPLANSEDRIMRREATLLPVYAGVTALADSKPFANTRSSAAPSRYTHSMPWSSGT
jgi:hypothetical protein